MTDDADEKRSLYDHRGLEFLIGLTALLAQFPSLFEQSPLAAFVLFGASFVVGLTTAEGRARGKRATSPVARFVATLILSAAGLVLLIALFRFDSVFDTAIVAIGGIFLGRVFRTFW